MLVCRLDRALRELDLKWLFTLPTSEADQSAASSDLSPETLVATPYAHLVSALLLLGPSKAVRHLASSLLKSLWLLESVKALSSKSAAAAPAQHAQRAMLSLLLHWAPNMAGYPESVQPYFQLLTWIFNTTPNLPEHLKTEASSAKKKTGGKPSARSSAGQLKPRASSSGSFSTWDKAEGLFQDVLTPAVVTQIMDAVKLYNAVLANHMCGVTYQALQVTLDPV